jgi:hypothetical protein
MFSKTNDQLINEILDTMRIDLRHYADMEMSDSATESVRRELLAEALVALAEDYADFVTDRGETFAATE